MKKEAMFGISYTLVGYIMHLILILYFIRNNFRLIGNNGNYLLREEGCLIIVLILSVCYMIACIVLNKILRGKNGNVRIVWAYAIVFAVILNTLTVVLALTHKFEGKGFDFFPGLDYQLSAIYLAMVYILISIMQVIMIIKAKRI